MARDYDDGVSVGFGLGVASTCATMAIIALAYKLFKGCCKRLLLRSQSRSYATMIEAERAAKCRGNRVMNAPTCDWRPNGRYACFLSHFKREAGSDARYINDLLQRVLGANVFLDSNDLSDLRHLFDDGVHQSDVLVLLATKSVLHRPWCLLEIHEAVTSSIPVVVISVAGGGFDFTEATTFIHSLEEELDRVNPGASDEIYRYLGGASLSSVEPSVCSTACSLQQSTEPSEHNEVSRVAVFDALKRSLLAAITRGQFVTEEVKASRRYEAEQRTGAGSNKRVRLSVGGEEPPDSSGASGRVRRLSSLAGLLDTARNLTELVGSVARRAPAQLPGVAGCGSARTGSIAALQMPEDSNTASGRSANATVADTAASQADLAAEGEENEGTAQGPATLLTRQASLYSSHHSHHMIELEVCDDAPGAEMPNGATTSGGSIEKPALPFGRRYYVTRTGGHTGSGTSNRTWMTFISSRFTKDEGRSTSSSAKTALTRITSFLNKEPALPAKLNSRLVWHPHGSDNQVLADIDDLVTRMAEVTGRKLRWRPRLGTRETHDELLIERTETRARHSRRGALASPEVPLAAVRGATRHLGEKQFAAFISYCRGEAGSDARFLQGRLREMMGRPIFLDADATTHEDEHGILVNGVMRSSSLVLLQTANVLASPWVLLEIYTAVRNGIPVIPVMLVDRCAEPASPCASISCSHIDVPSHPYPASPPSTTRSRPIGAVISNPYPLSVQWLRP